MPRFLHAGLLAAVLLPGPAAFAAVVTTDHPGGNGIASNLAPDRVLLAPDLRDTKKGEWWFYWNVALRDTIGPVELVFAGKKPIGPRGPAVSHDAGLSWSWMGSASVREERASGRPVWSVAVTSGARYAFAPQYLQEHLAAWRRKQAGRADLRVDELCRSRKGRSVELVRIGAEGAPVVLLTSRHHCCETMATYALEGLLDAVLADTGPGPELRGRLSFVAVPFMDKDGCEEGDQGKNRAPHDHNRDYNASPLYPEVAALMRLGAALSNRVIAAIDLHCPYISGEWNDRVYMVGSPVPSFARSQQAFASAWEQEQTGPIRFRSRDVLAFGSAWNTTNNFVQGRSASAWARDTHPDARLVTTIEIP